MRPAEQTATMATSSAAAPFGGGESIRKQVSPSRRHNNAAPSTNTASIQITHITGTSTADDAAQERVILTGVAWKRRSGFGRLSDTVGAGKSWERRRFVLYAGGGVGGTTSSARLVYYSVNSYQNQATPRGTLDLLAERATVHAPHYAANEVAGAQPTPYTLSIRTTDGITPENTKWKLCFDDRYAQMAWLVALTDVVVEASVRQCNAATLAAEHVGGDHGFLGLGMVGGGDHHGGFHRLYEEGVPAGGLLGVVRTALLDAGKSDDNDDEVDINTASEEQKQMQADKIRENENVSQSPKRYAPMESFVEMEATASAELKAAAAASIAGDDGKTATVKSFGATDPPLSFDGRSLLHALAVVNLSVLYAHFTAKSTSFLVISWWQVLLAVNVCLYICLAPMQRKTDDDKGKHGKKEADKTQSREIRNIEPNEQNQDEITSIEKNDTDVSLEMTKSNLTKSMIGAELLRGEDVPLSDEPTAAEASQLGGGASGFDQRAETHRHRVEALTEKEMSDHDHERWAVSAPDVDLSGSWTLIADDAFKKEYDQYLRNLGFNRITRGVACSLIGRTLEETKQSEGGRKLYLKGTNPKGEWTRTLIASGYPDFHTHPTKKPGRDYQHSRSFIKTVDAEDVSAEAWWEDKGTVHRSWLRGGTKYGGGDFESLRYLEEGSDGQILVCRSIFHPKDLSKPDAVVTWRFKRNETELAQA